MAAKLGALLGGGSEKQIEVLGRFAETAGIVFQIQDDILNISTSQSIGKEFGDDIKEGKRTLLVINTLNMAPRKDSERLLEILKMHTSDEKLIAEAIAIINKQDSVANARKIAAEMAEQSWRDVEELLPESEAKQQLKQLSGLMLNRSV